MPSPMAPAYVPAMPAMRHAFLARLLVRQCGGEHEAAAACRLSHSRLQEFTDPTKAAFMPADVIADLEAYCGEPVYSLALVELRPAQGETATIVTEVCELAETAAELQKAVRLATVNGRLTPAACRSIEAGAAVVEDELRGFRTALGKAGEPS